LAGCRALAFIRLRAGAGFVRTGFRAAAFTAGDFGRAFTTARRANGVFVPLARGAIGFFGVIFFARAVLVFTVRAMTFLVVPRLAAAFFTTTGLRAVLRTGAREVAVLRAERAPPRVAERAFVRDEAGFFAARFTATLAVPFALDRSAV
jgi:hypothetical protein